MLGFVSRTPIPLSYYLWETERSLLWMSCSGRRAPHRDGMGWVYKGAAGRMILQRWGREELHQLEGNGRRTLASERTTLLLAHARQASVGYQEMTSAQAHPFVEDGIFLAHNGTIRDADLLGTGGSTDTQKLLHWLIGHWQPRNLSELKGALQKLLTRVENYSAIDLLITEGSHLYAFCCYKEDPQQYTLHYRQVRERVTVASQPPLDEGGWQSLQHGELLQISPDLAVKKEHVI